MNERERYAQSEALFHELIELDPQTRQQRLQRLATADPDLHARMLALLAESVDLRARERALDALVEEARSFAGAESDVPTQVGPYRILRLLGEGGMGRVYEAEQLQPVQRRVALKLTRSGLDPERVMARFQAERQALAVLDHPNIARIFDAGSEADGRPWFAMELVDGEPITRYAKGRKLSLRQRIELLLPVCDAVQHAHRKGVIHRDLKPSNLLVVEQDGQPLPKVIDFGVAKAVQTESVDARLATRDGELVGTLEYMSPEQAAMGSVDIDTRSDVYALGLVLYELLVGELPMSVQELRRFAFDELCRRIREDDTPRPSERLASLSADGRVDTASTDWVRRLRGDLDSVVLKALAKDREQRYGTAAAFADDLRRFLDHQAVLARPPSLGYRIRKFVRRNTAASVAATAIAVSLVAATLIATAGLREAEQARIRAEASRASAEATAEFMIQLFQAADPRAHPGDDPSARDLLDRGVVSIASLNADPEVRARLLQSLGSAALAMGDYERAAPLIDQALALRESAASGDPLRLATLLDRRGALQRDRSEFAAAVQSHRQALAVLEQAGLARSVEAAGLLNNLGIALRRASDFEGAVATYQQALALSREIESQPSIGAASALANLAAVQQTRGDFAAARVAFTEALALFEQLRPPLHPDLGTLHSNLALSNRSLGDLQGSLAHIRAAREIDEASLPPDHPERADTLHNEAAVLKRLGQMEAAGQALQEARRIYAAALGEEHPRTLITADTQAQIDLAEGRAQAAAIELRRIADQLEKTATPSAQRHRCSVLRTLARAERSLGELSAAAQTARQAGLLAEQLERTEDQAIALLLQALIALDQQQDAAAQALWNQSLELAGACRNQPCMLDRADTSVLRAHYLARVGELEPALQSLALAVDSAGWNASLLQAPDLEALRPLAAWRSLEDRLAARLRD